MRKLFACCTLASVAVALLSSVNGSRGISWPFGAIVARAGAPVTAASVEALLSADLSAIPRHAAIARIPDRTPPGPISID
jgi:hypothetical protein